MTWSTKYTVEVQLELAFHDSQEDLYKRLNTILTREFRNTLSGTVTKIQSETYREHWTFENED